MPDPTLRTVARALDAHSLRAAAATLHLAPPITARRVIAAFIRAAIPRAPVDLAADLQFWNTHNFVFLSWRDPSPRYAKATSANLRDHTHSDAGDWGETLSALPIYQGGSYQTNPGVGEVSWAVQGINEYGTGPWSKEAHFTTPEHPAPASPPSPPPPPPPPRALVVSAINFFNCDPESVSVSLADHTAGGEPANFGPFAAFTQTGTACGPGFTQGTTIPLIGGTPIPSP
ncbi:MAG: hypothetical protein ACR2FH_05380 [Caulobacteraceae bacterium]